MSGFAAGRLQTGGRASGLAQAALERTAEYANDRKQFGQPIGEFQLTQYKLGRMATHVTAARQLTYAAALAMDADESIALEPAMAKLFASDVAVWVTQEGQLLHGGWGYAEEFADLALRRRRHGAADLRGREADPRAEGHRAAPVGRVEPAAARPGARLRKTARAARPAARVRRRRGGVAWHGAPCTVQPPLLSTPHRRSYAWRITPSCIRGGRRSCPG